MPYADKEKERENRRKYRENNSDYFLKVNERSKKWRIANPEKMKASIKAWRILNFEKEKITQQEWRKANIEKIKIKSLIYRKNNLEKFRTYRCKRRTLKRNAEGSHTVEDIRNLHERQKGKCMNCKIAFKKTGYHVDHIVPLSKGGNNGPSNLQLLCPKCNQSKNAKDPIKWAQENGRLL